MVNCGVCGKTFTSKRALQQHKMSHRTQRSNAPRYTSITTSPMILRETEIIWDMTEGTKGEKFRVFQFCPGDSGITVLDKFAKIFDNYHLLAARIEYKPAVGLNTDGKVWCGIDYTVTNPSAGASDCSKIARCQPNFVTGAVRPASLTVPSSLANPRRIMKCVNIINPNDSVRSMAIAFQILIGYDVAKAPGLIYIHYVVGFSGVTSNLAWIPDPIPTQICEAIHIRLSFTISSQGDKSTVYGSEYGSYITNYCNGMLAGHDIEPKTRVYDLSREAIVSLDTKEMLKKGVYEIATRALMLGQGYTTSGTPPQKDIIYFDAGGVADLAFTGLQNPYYYYTYARPEPFMSGAHFLGHSTRFTCLFADDLKLRFRVTRESTGQTHVVLDTVLYYPGSNYVLSGYDLLLFVQFDMTYENEWQGNVWGDYTIVAASGVVPVKQIMACTICNDVGIGPEFDSMDLNIPQTAPGIYRIIISIYLLPKELLMRPNSNQIEISVQFGTEEIHFSPTRILTGRLTDRNSTLDSYDLVSDSTHNIPSHHVLRVRLRGTEAWGVVKGTMNFSMRLLPHYASYRAQQDVNSDGFVIIDGPVE